MLHSRPYLRLLLLLLCFLTAFNGWAQPYYFRHYQVENGLSNNTVFCSIQGKNGFIWFGTKEGLNRFDGYHFKKIQFPGITPENPHAEFVFNLYNDPNGTLWVGSAPGLFRYDEKKEALVPLIDSLREINSILMDKEGKLWFTSIFTLHCYDFVTNTCKTFPTDQYFNVISLSMTPKGAILLTSDDGYVYRYRPDSKDFQRFDVFKNSSPPASKWVHRAFAENDSMVLVGTSNQGLKRLNLNSGQYTDIISHNPDKTSIYVRDIMRHSLKEYWLATESGIFILDIESDSIVNLRKKVLDPYSLSDNAVYTLCKDFEGGIWAGTFFGGVNYYPRPYTFFQKYFPDNSRLSINGSAVREIYEDKNKQLWIGTEDAGLNRLDPQTGEITQFEPTGQPGSISYSNIHGLLPDGNDLWIGTFEHGIDLMDINTGKVKKHFTAGPNSLRSNFALSFIKNKQGNIYAATSNGVAWYVPAIDNFTVPPGAPGFGFIAALLEDHTGIIWIGSHGDGLYAYDPVTHSSINYKAEKNNPNSLSGDVINAIYEDEKHQLWISTDGGGLCKLDADRQHFSTLTTRNGLPSNYVFKAIQDQRGQFWISTSKGLVNLDPGNNKMQVYTKENGLLNDQFNYSSGFLRSDGSLYFGSIKGMIRFNPARFFDNAFQPNLFITGLQVQNKEVPISPDSSYLQQSVLFTDQITLPHDRSSFSLDFAALSFTSPEITEYSYKMDGIDQDWTYLKTNRKAYFTNLAPGNYTFRVKAAINGKWSDKEKALRFSILPPWWATNWARILYSLMGAGLVYYIAYTYHRRTQVRKEKEIYEAKIDFFTNVAHEIKTPLTLIKGPLDNMKEHIEDLPEIREDLQTMDRNTNRLVALIQQILDFRKTEARGFRLEFSRENISTILEEAYLNFQVLAKKRELVYTLQLPDNDVYAYADEEALNKIFSNLLSNATKYAAETVIVKLYPVQNGDDNLVIEIDNDGYAIPLEMRDRIFEPFFRLKETSRQKGTGIGLSLARSLAELHMGKLYLQEPKDGLNRFVLLLPLQQEVAETKTTVINTSYQTN